MEPNPDDVLNLSAICGFSEEEATKWLKRYNDLQSACNAYFENPNALEQEPAQTDFLSWDEDAFHADKNTVYGPQTQTQASYNIHSEDALRPNVFDGAMSRPPSRVSNRGAMPDGATSETHVLSCTSRETYFSPKKDSNKELSFAEREEQDVQKAMAMSMSQTLPGQESGVTEISDTHFGPATRPYYAQEQWALTATRMYAQEILQNPDPEDRKREPGVPAFMKPSPARHFLPSLITILHSVPMAREALLVRKHLLPDYGNSGDWWDGMPIEGPKVVNLDLQYEEIESEGVVQEAQRLMAFLDQTDRAYGSTDVLANLGGIREKDPTIIEGVFLEQWTHIVSNIEPAFELGDTFKSVAMLGATNRDFWALELALNDNIVDSGMSLYEALDDALYMSYTADDPEEIYLEKVSDVLIVRPHRSGEGSGLGIKIPSVWYLDRYLKDSIAATLQMRKDKEALAREMNRIADSKARLSTFQRLDSDGKSFNAEELLAVAKSHFVRAPTVTGSADSSVEGNDSLEMDALPDTTAYQKISAELEAVAQRVAQKFKALEESKEQALEQMRELSKLYTKPSDNETDPPHHKYTLRGVATTPQTTYVLANPNGADDLIDTVAEDWQWWKISFSTGNVKPIEYTKVREVEVLKAAKDQSRSALLVYASERAISYKCDELPSQLRNFVRVDNLAFAGELQKAALPMQMTPTQYDVDEMANNDTRWRNYQNSEMPDADLIKTSSLNTTSGRGMPPPPPYTKTKPPPPLPRSSLSRNKPRDVSSYDDFVPISLSNAEGFDPSAHVNTDLIGDIDEVYEMRQKINSGFGIVPGGTGPGVGEYALGDYVPEIRMDDLEDSSQDEKKKAN